ncbi:hypothetical protein P7K49_026171 [Saguinus oedipus]|uniref:Uncharacterized protein n=1 Tax=Saguinus oedipus TaxID=9490 RepID=A0ABQ9UDE3_SAGOE|nr:hypothetical protein P7K49_026171 [Saguinus oedipus]
MVLPSSQDSSAGPVVAALCPAGSCDYGITAQGATSPAQCWGDSPNRKTDGERGVWRTCCWLQAQLRTENRLRTEPRSRFRPVQEGLRWSETCRTTEKHAAGTAASGKRSQRLDAHGVRQEGSVLVPPRAARSAGLRLTLGGNSSSLFSGSLPGVSRQEKKQEERGEWLLLSRCEGVRFP